MKTKHIFLAASLLVCILSIVLVILKGSPKDKVTLDPVSEVGESILHHIDKTSRMLTSVSDEEEMEIGDKIYEKAQKNRIAKNIEDLPLDKYVTAVGQKVAENVKRKNITYKFHIIDSDWPNAFAGAGGHIYITMGLLKELKTEAELAAILGHEITHVDAKHSIGSIQYKIKTEKITGSNIDTVVDIGYGLLFRPGYSEVQESEADLGGIYLAYKAGYHPLAVINAFENVNKAELSRTGTRAITPVGDTLKALGGMVGRYFATHPLTSGRIEKIKLFVEENKMADGRKYYIGEQNYIKKIPMTEKMYKEELAALYPSIKDEDKTGKEAEAQPIDEELEELYTVYGRISTGMDISEAEKILPADTLKFKRDTRVGYKDIKIYKFDTKELQETVGVWFELDGNKITKIRIIK